MHKKSIAKKPRKAWDILSYWCATLNVPDFQMSSEPVSLFREEEHIDFFKSLAKLPDEINLVSPDDLRPDEVPKGYCVLYEYPFKIGFSWPFSPLGDNVLILNTAVNDRGWKHRYVFLQVASVSDEDNQWLSSGWNESVIDFSVVKPRRDSLNKVQRILERSIADRSFSLRSNDEEDEVVLVAEVTPTESSHQGEEKEEEEREERREGEMTEDSSMKSAAQRRAEQLELARQGREKSKKRSAPPAGVDPRRDTVAGVDLGGSTKVTKDAPWSGVSGANKSIFEVPSSSLKEEKNKEKVGETIFKVTLPSDFMVNDVLERDVIFPHLGKFLLPTFRDRYNDSRVEDTGAHVAGLSFMAFQACLSFYAQTEGLRAAFPDVQKRADEALEKEKVALEAVEAEKMKVESLKAKLVEAQNEKIEFSDHVLELEAITTKLEVEKIKATTVAAASADEVTSLLKKVESLEGDVKDLEEENQQFEAFSRLTARVALMRRHLSGKNPMASAVEELKTYLEKMGTERDLDEDDELDGNEGGEEEVVSMTDVVQEQAVDPQVTDVVQEQSGAPPT
ncbi:hypothetical protein L6452_06023 [Arctium lappa]|uniref:Uncharacterized protein n=1 Tax=Arctium lappa TaxID=4217 RepID=A0ACB9EI28_ARCLA|nr:hypothetical protein L6452_06023 [Arctium lappa]